MSIKRLLTAVSRNLFRQKPSYLRRLRRRRWHSGLNSIQPLECRTLLSSISLRVGSSIGEWDFYRIIVYADPAPDHDLTIPINVPQQLLDDYALSSEIDNVVVPKGLEAGFLTFTVPDDGIAQPDATYRFSLGPLADGLTPGDQTYDDLTIAANEPVSLTVTDTIVAEGQTARLDVNLSHPASEDIEATFVVVGEQTSAESAAGGYQVMFPAGTTKASLEIPTEDISDLEGDRTLRVELTGVADNGILVYPETNIPLAPALPRDYVESITWTPNSQAVIYIRGFEVVSVPADGGNTHVLNRLGRFEVDPQSRRVAVARERGVSVTSLDGTNPVAITHAANHVRQIRFTPDGRKLVFVSGYYGGEMRLWSADTSGGRATLLGTNVPYLLDGDIKYVLQRVQQFLLTPDGRGVLILGETTRPGHQDLLYFDLHDGRVHVLNTPAQADADVTDFDVSPDGRYVVYQESVADDYTVRLSATDLLTRQTVLLDTVYSFPIESRKFAISSDGTAVVYHGRLSDTRQNHLYSVPIGGGTSRRLTEGEEFVRDFKMTPNGQAIIYRSTRDSGSTRLDIYAVPLSGGPSTRLSHHAFRSVEREYLISDDSQRVLYTLSDRSELYSVSITGGTGRAVHPPLTDGQSLPRHSVRLTPDGQYVVFRIYDRQTGGGIYRAHVAGGSFKKLSSFGNDTRGSVKALRVSPDGQRVAYAVEIEGLRTPQLYIADVTTSRHLHVNAEPQMLSPRQAVRTGDGRHLIVRATLEPSVVHELFRIPVNGGPAVRLSHELPFGWQVRDFIVSPDSESIVYTTGPDESETSYHGVSVHGGEIVTYSAPAVAKRPVIDSTSQWLLFYDRNGRPHSLERIDGTEIITSDQVQLPTDAAQFSPDGTGFYFSHRPVSDHPFDLFFHDLTTRVTTQLTDSAAPSLGATLQLVAADGTVFYSRQQHAAGVSLVRFDPETQTHTAIWQSSTASHIGELTYLPLSNRLVWTHHETGESHLVSFDVRSQTSVILANDYLGLPITEYVVSADERFVAFSVAKNGSQITAVTRVDGTQDVITDPRLSGRQKHAFTPDAGQLIVHTQPTPWSGYVWQIPTDGSAPVMLGGGSNLETRETSFQLLNEGRQVLLPTLQTIHSLHTGQSMSASGGVAVTETNQAPASLRLTASQTGSGFTVRPIVATVNVTVLDAVDRVSFASKTAHNSAAWQPVRGTDGTEIYLEAVDQPRVQLERDVQSGNTFELGTQYPLGRYRLWVRGMANGRPTTAWAATIIEQRIAPDVQTSLEGTTLTVNWNSVHGATSYRVYVQHLRSGSAPIVDSILTQNSATVDVGAFGRYRLWVQAIADDSTRVWSAAINHTSTVQLNGVGNTFAGNPRFQWSGVADADSYDVYILRDGQLLVNTNVRFSIYEHPTPLEQGRFRWWVRPVSSTGQKGPWSSADEFRTGGRTTVLPLPEYAGDIPVVQWEQVIGAASYEVLIWNLRTRETPYRVAGLTDTQFQPTRLDDSDYRVWVRAHHSNGTAGQWSPPVDFELDAIATLHQAWPDTAAQGSFSPTPELTWQSHSAAVEYDVFLFDGQYQYHTTTQTHFTLPVGMNSSTIRWGVRVRNASGQTGPWSEAVVRLDATVQGLSFMQTASTRPAHFTWNPVNGAVAYELLVQTAQGEFLRESEITQPEFTASTRFAAAAYRVWVRAISSAGETGPWSMRFDRNIE